MQFRDHPAVQGKRDFYPVDPRALKVDPGYNVRDLSTSEAKSKLDELSESIAANGVRVPLEVRLDGEDIFVVSGHRRLAATMLAIKRGAEIATVPVIPEPKGVNEVERTVNLVVSNSGEPLTPLEKAEVVRRLLAFGWDRGQVAKRLGWQGTQTVDNYLTLLGADSEVQAMVRNGEVSASTAVRAVRKEGRGAGATLKKAKAVAEAKGKKKVTAKSVRTAAGEIDLKPKQVMILVAALRWVSVHGDDPSSNKAQSALRRAGVDQE